MSQLELYKIETKVVKNKFDGIDYRIYISVLDDSNYTYSCGGIYFFPQR